MLSPQALGIALAVTLTYFLGVETVRGVKWVGHQFKRGGTIVVHLIHHPKESQ